MHHKERVYFIVFNVTDNGFNLVSIASKISRLKMQSGDGVVYFSARRFASSLNASAEQQVIHRLG